MELRARKRGCLIKSQPLCKMHSSNSRAVHFAPPAGGLLNAQGAQGRPLHTSPAKFLCIFLSCCYFETTRFLMVSFSDRPADGPMAAPTKGSETPCDICGGMWACRPTGAVDHGGAPCRGAHGASVRVAAKGRRAADCHPTMRCTIDFACRGALYMRPCRVAFCRRLAENAGALGRIYNPPLQVQCDFPPHS